MDADGTRLVLRFLCAFCHFHEVHAFGSDFDTFGDNFGQKVDLTSRIREVRW